MSSPLKGIAALSLPLRCCPLPEAGMGELAGPSRAAKLKLSLEQQKVGSRPLISSAISAGAYTARNQNSGQNVDLDELAIAKAKPLALPAYTRVAALSKQASFEPALLIACLR